MLPRDAPAVKSANESHRPWSARRARPAPTPAETMGCSTNNASAIRSPRQQKPIHSRGRSNMTSQLRAFLCACGVLYVVFLWKSGLWSTTTTPTISEATTPASMRAATTIQAPVANQRAVHKKIHSFPSPTPQTVNPSTTWPSSTTRATEPVIQSTPAAIVAAVHKTTRHADGEVTASTPTSNHGIKMLSVAATPATTIAATVGPTSTPEDGGPQTVPTNVVDLIHKSPKVPSLSTTDAPLVLVSYDEHMAHMSVLEDKRLRAMSAIGILKNKLHKVREQLQIHAAIIADEDAKRVVDLPADYKNQHHQRKFRCLGWRATENCDPNGKRVPDKDRTCQQVVLPKMAGFCEVEDTTTKERFRVMKTSCDTLRYDASLKCLDAWHFPNFAIQSHEVLKNASRTNVGQKPTPTNLTPTPTNWTPTPTNLTPTPTNSRGVVLVVYPKMLPSAYATLRKLRAVGCVLAVEMWYLPSELPDPEHHAIIHKMLDTYGPMTLRSIDDPEVKGYTTKIHAIRHSAFDHVLFLDADNVPVKDPTFLFDLPQYQTTGALFWPDFWHPNHTIFTLHERSLVWEYLDLPFVDMFEQESGQLVIDKTKSHVALALLHFYAFHQPNLLDKFKIVHGDKDLFRLAWLKSNTSFHMVDRPPGIAGNLLDGMFCGQTMVQFDPDGEILFLHRNAKKLEGRHFVPLASTVKKKAHFHPLVLEDHGVVPVPAIADQSYEEPVQEEQVDPEIWTHLLQLKPTSSIRNYTVEIYEGNKAFPKGQWCYGKPSPSTPHFNTFRFADLPIRDVETEIRGYAIEATDLLQSDGRVQAQERP